MKVARRSGHAGDAFLDIKPSKPAKGEQIEVGVGRLHLGRNYLGNRSIVLQPEDGRPELWLDPRVLYRLHDQTIDLFIEPTSDVCTPAPALKPVAAGVIANGDGTFQTKFVDPRRAYLPPKIESLGNGAFRVTAPTMPKAGEQIPYEHDPFDLFNRF